MKARILFADDNTKFVDVRSELLKRNGYEVIPAYSPAEARRVLRNDEIDLAILDLHLNGGGITDHSGLEVAMEFPKITSIIITNEGTSETPYPVSAESTHAIRDVLREAIDVVFKDESEDAFLKAVRRALIPRVFVAHGHDEGAKTIVVRVLEQLGVRPIVLQDEAGAGRPILQRIDEYSNVEFAVVILTPDDVGGPAHRSRKQPLQPRARQNVIFEWGFFSGRLERHRVVALKKGGVEIPSDYGGVVYIDLSAADWKLQLAKELEKGGIALDLKGLL
jgi:predicted nucleotide-binding protein